MFSSQVNGSTIHLGAAQSKPQQSYFLPLSLTPNPTKLSGTRMSSTPKVYLESAHAHHFHGHHSGSSHDQPSEMFQ